MSVARDADVPTELASLGRRRTNSTNISMGGAGRQGARTTDKNIGCSTTWFTETYNGFRIPDYLQPASNGFLLTYTQTTLKMGKYANSDGQKCISGAIWDADTILPGQTPLKWILGYGEESNTNVCE